MRILKWDPILNTQKPDAFLLQERMAPRRTFLLASVFKIWSRNVLMNELIQPKKTQLMCIKNNIYRTNFQTFYFSY